MVPTPPQYSGLGPLHPMASIHPRAVGGLTRASVHSQETSDLLSKCHTLGGPQWQPLVPQAGVFIAISC